MGYLRVLNSNIQWCRKSFSLHKCAILIHFGCHFPTVRQPHITLLLLPMMLYHMIYQFSLWFHILGTFKKHTPVLLQILSCRLSRRWVWNCRPWHSRGMRRSSGGSSPIFTGCINHPQMVGLWQVYHRLPQYIFQSIYINWINRKSHWGCLNADVLQFTMPVVHHWFHGDDTNGGPWWRLSFWVLRSCVILRSLTLTILAIVDCFFWGFNDFQWLKCAVPRLCNYRNTSHIVP